MTIKILGENPKWCLGVAATSHTLCALCAEDVRRKAEQNCGDVNERCAAIGGTLIPVGTKNFFSTPSSRSNWPFAPSLLELLGVATTD